MAELASSRGDSNTELTNKLVALNDSVSQRNLDIVKLVAKHAFDIKQQDLDEAQLLTAVYTLIEKKHEDAALNIIIIILMRLDVQRSLVDALKHHVKKNEVLIEGYQKMDFILTVSNILCGLHERQYLSLREIARRTFLPTYDPSNITSRTHLFQLLLDQGCFTQTSFYYLFAWLEVIGCSARQAELRGYCRRHNIDEPEWQFLIPSLKKTFPLASASVSDTHPPSSPRSFPATHSLPDTALRDGGTSVDGSHSKQAAHFPTSIGRNDCSPSSTPSYHNPVSIPSVGTSGPTSFVAASRSSIPTDLGELVGGQTRREPKSQFSLDTDESNEIKRSRSSTTELSHPQLETLSEEEEMKEDCDMKAVSRLVDVTAIPTDVSINGVDQPVSKEPRLPAKIRDWLCHYWSRIILVALLIVVLLCIGGASGVLTYYFIGPNPDSKNVTLAENATVLVGCYNPLHIGSVTISATAKTVFGFYNISQSLLIATLTNLPTTTYKRSGAGQYINFNYYNFAPLYTAGPGTIAYSLNFINLPPSGGKNACFYSFLYHSYDAYDQTLNGSPSSDYDDYYMVCPNATGVVYPFDLSIPKSGFYYVTAFVPLGMDFVVAISASVPLYNTSDLQALGCQLNSDTSYCSLSIGKKGIRTHPGKVCVLASSSSSKYNNVVEAAVHFVHYFYNIGSVASFISGVSLIIITLVTVIILIVYCIYRRCKRRHRQDYEQLH